MKPASLLSRIFTKVFQQTNFHKTEIKTLLSIWYDQYLKARNTICQEKKFFVCFLL